jgi:hypothetical protein
MSKKGKKPHYVVGATGGQYVPTTTTPKPAPKPLQFNATSQTKTITPIGTTQMPTVYYTRDAWTKMWKIVELCPEEVGWLGMVDKTETGDYLITEIFLLEQEVSGVTTDIESDAVANLAVDLESRGLDSTKLRFWGHSHVNMGVSPSGTDENQTNEYIEHCDFFIRGIYNKKMEAKVDVFDMNHKLVYQKVDHAVKDDRYDAAWLKELKDEIAAKVKKRVYAQPAYNGYGGLRNNQAIPAAQMNQQFKNQRDQYLNWRWGDYDKWDY